MKNTVTAIIVAFVTITASGPAAGHHGSNVVYDLTKSITVTGVVAEYQFVNPHTQILFEVTAQDGSVVSWLGGLPSSSGLAGNEGWTRDTLKPGDEITVTGSPARNDAPSIWIEQVILNGEELLGRRYTG
jgi:hypothetical protein